MKIKRSVLFPALLLVMSLLGGCGGAATPAATAATTATTAAAGAETTAAAATEAASAEANLRICWWGNQTRNDRTVAVIKMYEEKNPGVKIEYEFSDWSGYWDKLATQAAGGTLPDIIQHDYAYLAQYVASNQLLDLTPYTADKRLDLTNVAESILAGGTIDSKLYGLCLGTNAPIMIYDKDIVAQAGVTMPAQPTIEELYDIGATVFEKTGKQMIFDGGYTMLAMMSRANGSVIYDDVNNGKTDNVLAHFTNVEKFATAPFIIPAETQAEKNPDVVETKPIIDRTTWNDFSFSNQFIAIAKAAGGNLAMVMYPQSASATTQTMYLKPSQFFTVAESSEYKDQAVAFLNWFTNDVDCNNVLLGERGIPVSSTVAEGIKGSVDAQTVMVFDYIAEVAKVATPIDPPNPPGAGEMGTYNNTVAEQIRYGAVTAADAAAQFMIDAKKILDDAAKK